MSTQSRGPSTHPVSPPQMPREAPARFQKKPFDGVHSIRKWIVVFGVANTLGVATAQTISLIMRGEGSPKVSHITVQLLILNILLVVCMVTAMRQFKRRSTPYGPLVGRAFITRILVAVAAVGVLFIYAIVPIQSVTASFQPSTDSPSPATSQGLVGGSVIAILYVTSGMQAILAILLGIEEYMEIRLRRSDLTSTQPEPQLYVYQPAIPLRSDFSHSHRATRTHFVGYEEDQANKDALPAYERQRPEDHPVVQIIDMAGSVIYIQEPQDPSTVSPPDYDIADVTPSEISQASTAAAVAAGSEVRPQGLP